MRKISEKKNSVLAVIFAAAMGFAIISCGNAGSADPARTQETEQTDAAQTENAGNSADNGGSEAAGQNTDTAVDQNEDKTSGGGSGAEHADKLTGEWTLVYTDYHSEYSDGDTYDNITMATDSYAPQSEIKIREDGDGLLIDYRMSAYESEYRYYGLGLDLKKEAAYEGCANKDWCMVFVEPFENENEGTSDRKVTLLDDDTLIEVEEYASEEGSEYYYHSITTNTYYRKTDPRLNDPEGLRYFDTVTVSDATELLNNIKNNTKVILKAGKYHLYDIPANDIKNDNLTGNGDAYTINGVSNFCIEAENGADVLLDIASPYDSVLRFENATNITLRGLTVGHDVEPGYCSGSVVCFSGVTGVTIDKCKLYGSGTYGIETESCSELEVVDSDIYECTYGLLSLYSTSTAHFKNCVFRDSYELSMIDVNSGYDIIFEDCEFRDNEVKYDSCYFISQQEYDDVTFKKCKFVNNKYFVFSNYQVKMEDCDMENNNAKYSDMINFQEVDDASDLLNMYDDVKKRQEQIDEKLEKDTTLDQLSLNQLAYEEFDMWDSLLNRIWAYLGNTMDEKAFEALTAEQKEWVKTKETAVKDAGADFEGGSMQPMVENGKGAELTQKRVKYLVEKYLQG